MTITPSYTCLIFYQYVIPIYSIVLVAPSNATIYHQDVIHSHVILSWVVGCSYWILLDPIGQSGTVTPRNQQSAECTGKAAGETAGLLFPSTLSRVEILHQEVAAFLGTRCCELVLGSVTSWCSSEMTNMILHRAKLTCHKVRPMDLMDNRVQLWFIVLMGGFCSIHSFIPNNDLHYIDNKGRKQLWTCLIVQWIFLVLYES